MSTLVIKLTEKQIEHQIMGWLKYSGVFVFKVENGGVFDQKRGAFRFNHALRLPGIADIIGLYEGVALAIEVKSAKGRLSPAQISFRDLWLENGGKYVLARSVEDVEQFIGEIKKP